MRRGLKRLAGACSLAGFVVLGGGVAPALAATDVDYFPDSLPSGSEIDIDGEADVDLISLSVADNTVTITDTGPGGIASGDPDCTDVNPTTITCPLDPPGADQPVDFVDVTLDAANDTYTNHNLLANNDIDPDEGDDVVQSGPANDFIDDSPGNDNQDGGEGDDFLDGTSGDDLNGADLLNGGAGDDSVDYGGYSVGVDVTFDGQANDGRSGEGDNVIQVESVDGTDFDDSLTGDNGPNEFFGESGEDLITGLAGNDELFGGAGDDIVNGGASPDGSRDLLSCGRGFDIALAEPLDTVEAGCERRGATIAGESAKVKRKGKAKVLLACAPEAGAPCAGTLSLFTGGKQISSAGSFDVPAGAAASARVKLTGKGKKALGNAGGKLLATAQAQTVETSGVAITEAQVLLTGKAKKKKK